MSHWGGETSRSRGQEKIYKVLDWLYQFDFSTRQILCGVLGLETHRGQGVFFKRLMDEGLIEPMHSPLIRHHVYRLTDAGRELAYLGSGQEAPYARRRNASPAVQIHDLTVQAAALRRSANMVSAKAERHLSTGNEGKVPDALLIYENGDRVALEVELSHKNAGRVYYNFLCHLRNINQESYQKVTYVFPTRALANNYQQKFLKESWPIYKPDKNRRLKLQPNEYSLKSEHHHYFEFVVEPPYNGGESSALFTRSEIDE